MSQTVFEVPDSIGRPPLNATAPASGPCGGFDDQGALEGAIMAVVADDRWFALSPSEMDTWNLATDRSRDG